jgi:uncharacterized protein YbcC (UPF0753/DUF2309 family)
MMLEEAADNPDIPGISTTIIVALIGAIALIIREYMGIRRDKYLAGSNFSRSQRFEVSESFLIPFLNRKSAIVERGYLQPGDTWSLLRMIDSAQEKIKLDSEMEIGFLKLKKALNKSQWNLTYRDKFSLFIRRQNVQQLKNAQVIEALQDIQSLYDRIYRPLYTKGD